MDVLIHIHIDRLRIRSSAPAGQSWGSPLCNVVYFGLSTQPQEKSGIQMLEKYQMPKGCPFTFPYDSHGSWHSMLACDDPLLGSKITYLPNTT